MFENYKAYPSIIAMVNDMLKGHEGAAEYTFDRIGDRPVGQIKKYAVYKPIQLGNTFWSIVVASAEQDVLSGLISFRNRLILIVGIIFLFGIVFSLLGARAWLIVKEEGKRKQAEEKIKEAKEEWERTFDSIVDPLMILDTNYRIVKANKAMAEALGKTPEETVGLTCYEHVHGMNNPKPECPHKKLLADGKPHMTEIYEDLLGGWFLVSVSPLHDSRGNLTGSVHYARNITELKQAEEEIRKREDEMKQAQEVAHIGSWHLDVPGNELKWSDEVYRIFGIPFNMPLTYEAFLDRVHPEDRAYVNSCWKAALARQPYDIEHRIMVEGEVKWVHEKADLVFSQEGEPLSGVGIVQDISERKKAEDELKKYREHLEGLVKERTAELEAKITEIQRLNKLFIGRELDMIEIKKRIKELEKQTGSSSKD
ncbi:MAG: PAS domain S-box protein [Nitrospirae bacterium]|nr:PAS domain S-box protein [Nitrospirota bacterium]